MIRKLVSLQRYGTLTAAILLMMVTFIIGFWHTWVFVLCAIFAALTLLGLRDMAQDRHAVLRNYPILGHLRFLFEKIRPEIRQYLIESDQDEQPFSREQRSLVYQRAKGAEDKRPFGSHEKFYEAGYSWLTHSVQPTHLADTDFRITIGGPDCKQPYNASLYNISAMSFGSLSANAILALNKGAKAGGFAHDTGEGGISRYHREGGGDLIYEVGSGYFGCRNQDGTFNPERFAEQAADDQINAVMSAVGYNFRLILKWLRLLLCQIIRALIA